MKKTETFRATGGRLILTCLLVFIFSCYVRADEGSIHQDTGVFEEGGFSLDRAQSAAEIKQSIAELTSTEPDIAEKAHRIRAAIFRQETEEKDILLRALDDRLRELSNFPVYRRAAGGPKDSSTVAENALPDGLRNQIDVLELGPDATADDLRKRDDLVGIIAGIGDPAVRYELLQYLETKEKNAQLQRN